MVEEEPQFVHEIEQPGIEPRPHFVGRELPIRIRPVGINPPCEIFRDVSRLTSEPVGVLELFEWNLTHAFYNPSLNTGLMPSGNGSIIAMLSVATSARMQYPA